MRVNFLLALVVATYAATCISASSAENVAQIAVPEAKTEANEAQFIDQVRRLKGSHIVSSGEEWWKSAAEEERALPLGNAKSLFGKLKGRVGAKNLAAANGVGTKVDDLTNKQIKEVTVATANAVKKDRRIWPRVKKFLKILYRSTIAAAIIFGVTAMLKD
uniref:RxLR effector protein n=1 Tax=Phytophthora sojae TaxID=67593 RepID=G1FSH0_PHYSO|nr:Avh260 [Phytophthora sojae]